jgi:hypothetical protein
VTNARNRAGLLALTCSFFLSACATVISGPRQSVKIDSVPQGARVFTAVQANSRQGDLLKRTEVGVTPMTVSITRKDGVVELEKEGYQLTRVPMTREMNPWFLGNFVMTSLVSSSIDVSTGAVNEYDPGEYRVELQPLETVMQPAGSAAPGSAPASSGNDALDDEGADEPFVPDVRPLGPEKPK